MASENLVLCIFDCVMLLAVKRLWLSFSFVRAATLWVWSCPKEREKIEQCLGAAESEKQGEAFVHARWSKQAAQTERSTIFLKSHRDWVGFLSIQLIIENC